MSFRRRVKKAKIDTSQMKEINGHYDELNDLHFDKQGYFLIRVNNTNTSQRRKSRRRQ